jgi:hypothetical protein
MKTQYQANLNALSFVPYWDIGVWQYPGNTQFNPEFIEGVKEWGNRKPEYGFVDLPPRGFNWNKEAFTLPEYGVFREWQAPIADEGFCYLASPKRHLISDIRALANKGEMEFNDWYAYGKANSDALGNDPGMDNRVIERWERNIPNEEKIERVLEGHPNADAIRGVLNSWHEGTEINAGWAIVPVEGANEWNTLTDRLTLSLSRSDDENEWMDDWVEREELTDREHRPESGGMRLSGLGSDFSNAKYGVDKLARWNCPIEPDARHPEPRLNESGNPLMGFNGVKAEKGWETVRRARTWGMMGLNEKQIKSLRVKAAKVKSTKKNAERVGNEVKKIGRGKRQKVDFNAVFNSMK